MSVDAKKDRGALLIDQFVVQKTSENIHRHQSRLQQSLMQMSDRFWHDVKKHNPDLSDFEETHS